MIRAKVEVAGLLTERGRTVWTREFRRRVRAGAIAGMNAARPMFNSAMRADMKRALKIRRPAALYLLSSRVYAERPNEMPAMYVGNIRRGTQWLDIHQHGGVIVGKGKNRGMLIPLLDTRIGRKHFRRIVAEVLRRGAGWWKQDGDRVILMAEYQPELGQALQPFRRQYRAATGASRVKAGTDIPIAVLVKRVAIPKRLRTTETVISLVPRLARMIEARTTFED